MAKIYETKEDLEREQLSQTAERARSAQSSAAIVTGVGLALLLGGFLKKKPVVPEIPEGLSFFKRMGWRVRNEPFPMKTNGSIIAAFGAIGAWISGSKAKQAEAELQKLGPETVVFPPPPPATETECLPCRLKAGQPKSLLEYAVKNTGDRAVER